MKKLWLAALVAILLPSWCMTAEARTVTQGTLDIEHLATQISDDLKDYSQKRDVLVEDIKSVQSGLKKLKEDYKQAGGEKERLMIRARTLKETSRLLDFYSQFYKLNIDKAEAILPKLNKIKQAARKGALGQAARQLENPEFKKNITTLYSNLSTLAMKFNNPNLKKEMASLLKENELLYQQGRKGLSMFDDIAKNVDKVADYLRSIYARTLLKSRILEQRKIRTELAVELVRYALALKPLQQTMLQVNPEGIIDLPEIDIEEFLDAEPIISDSQYDNGDETTFYNDPEVDATLKGFQSGPNFLK